METKVCTKCGIEKSFDRLSKSPCESIFLELANSPDEVSLGKVRPDRLGLDKRNDEGIRLLPDGREMEIIVETAGEGMEQTDVLDLIRDDWRKVGIKLFIKTLQREVFRRRIFSGASMMSIWFGLERVRRARRIDCG